MIAMAVPALAMALLAWFLPRFYVGVGLVLVIASVVLRLAFPDSIVSVLDELVVVVGLTVFVARRAVARRFPVIPAWILWFAGFAAAGLISALLNEVPTAIALEGAFVAVKGVLFALMVVQLDWRADDLRPFAVGGAATIVALFGLAAANAIAPTTWELLLLGRDANFQDLGPIPALIGPFEHPAALGRFAALLAMAVVTYRLYVGGGWKISALLAMSSLTALASLRVKTIVSLVVGVGVVGFLHRRRIPRAVIIAALIVAVVAAVPVGIYVAIDVQQYLLSTSARSLLTVGAFHIAAREFPFGAGFGRYGSSVAASHYSPEYGPLGFPGYLGMAPPPNGQFLTDTAWPAVLGEAGWLGLFLFAAGLLHLLVDLWRARDTIESPLGRWILWTAMSWFVIILVESIGAPVFASAPSYPLPFIAAGIAFAIVRTQRDEGPPADRTLREKTPGREGRDD